MAAEQEIAFASATRHRLLIAERQMSPVELTQIYLERIERLDSRFSSYLTVTADEALAAAGAAEDALMRGEELPALHGIPISVKDLEMTKGVRTTSGSLIYQDRVPEEDSVIVERIRSAGAVMLGKTNTPEFGMSGMTDNRLGDHCRNPWNTERTTGGSSGGAGAAAVAGLCSLATGSDAGGSIRIPSSFCGIYGIKPTLGRAPRYMGAAAPLSANLLSQPGPMTRTVADSALLLQVMAGHDPRDPGSLREPVPDYAAAVDRDVSGLRMAWSPDYGYAAVDSEVLDVTSKAARVFEELGCTVDETALSFGSPWEAYATISSAGSYRVSGKLLERHGDLLTSYARRSIESGASVTGADYAGALGYVERLKAQLADLFEEYDLLLSPTMAVPAFPVGEPPSDIGGEEVSRSWGYLPFTYPINMAGLPAASIPCGFSSDGMPIGLHVVGRRLDEETVLTASAAFERARPWAHLRPPGV